MEVIMPPLKGLRNGLYYGGKVRFLHSFIMTLLFKKIDKKAMRQIVEMAWEHARNLGTFVFAYKLTVILLDNILGRGNFNNFVAGAVWGYFVFGRKKTPVNYQIVLYLFSRITVALVEFCYKKLAENRSKSHLVHVEKKYAYPIFAAVCWGVVMWLFEEDKSTLQASLTSSMQFLYKESNKPLKDWRELVPFYVPSFKP